ncbi:MAG: hypothetical protein KGD63_05940 [Candidatus Lokiarchaeota archaeon]|nr:hypothetical protein [Candidatus Lokiarchaeota archaeon]
MEYHNEYDDLDNRNWIKPKIDKKETLYNNISEILDKYRLFGLISNKTTLKLKKEIKIKIDSNEL